MRVAQIGVAAVHMHQCGVQSRMQVNICGVFVVRMHHRRVPAMRMHHRRVGAVRVNSQRQPAAFRAVQRIGVESAAGTVHRLDNVDKLRRRQVNRCTSASARRASFDRRLLHVGELGVGDGGIGNFGGCDGIACQHCRDNAACRDHR